MRRQWSLPVPFILLGVPAMFAAAPSPAAASSITLNAVASIAPAGEFRSRDLTIGLAPAGVDVLASGPSAEDFYVETFNVFAALARSYFRVDRGMLTLGVDVQASGSVGLTEPESAFVESFPWANVGNASASAAVTLSDQLAVVGGPVDGLLRATLLFSSRLDEGANSVPPGQSFSYGLIDGAIAGTRFSAYTDIGTALPAAAQVDIPYRGRSAPLDVVVVGWAVAGLVCPPPDQNTVTSCDGTGLARTELLLRSIQVLDEAGQAIADAYVTGGSGLVYANGVPGTPVPEPATLLLGGAALAVVVVVRSARSGRAAIPLTSSASGHGRS